MGARSAADAPAEERDDEENEDQKGDDPKAKRAPGVRAARAALGHSGLKFELKPLRHGLQSDEDAIAKSPVAKVGRHLIAQDPFGDHIGDVAFKTVADLEAHPAFFRGDDQKQPVVATLLSQFPDFCDFQRIRFDVVFAQRVGDENRQLNFAARIELFDKAANRVGLRSAEQARGIHQWPGQGRNGFGVQTCAEQKQRENRGKMATTTDQNSTFGAFLASSAIVNVARGSSLSRKRAVRLVGKKRTALLYSATLSM